MSKPTASPWEWLLTRAQSKRPVPKVSSPKPTKSDLPRGGKRVPIDKGTKQDCMDMLYAGKRVSEITRSTGIAASTVRLMRRNLGLPAQKATHLEQFGPLALQLGVQKRFTRAELRQHLGQPPHVVNRLLENMMDRGYLEPQHAEDVTGHLLFSVTTKGHKQLKENKWTSKAL